MLTYSHKGQALAYSSLIKKCPDFRRSAVAKTRNQLHNIVEQNHRGVKRITCPMLGFKAFEAAQATLAGIELMHMIKKRQLVVEEENEGRTAAEHFYALAA